MNALKNPQTRNVLRRIGATLPVAALMLIAGEAAANTGGTYFGDMVTTLTDMSGGIKAVIAIVGFIVALIGLVALRSFSAVLMFLGLAVFGSVALGVAQQLLGATVSLI